jgi:phosphoribosyl-ATP pyrophosphohydrolase
MNIFEKNYKAVQDRGLITKESRNYDFLNKADEEYQEIVKAYCLENNDNLNEEITDLMNVCSNWLIFRGLDPFKELEKVLEKNKKRAIIKE